MRERPAWRNLPKPSRRTVEWQPGAEPVITEHDGSRESVIPTSQDTPAEDALATSQSTTTNPETATDTAEITLEPEPVTTLPLQPQPIDPVDASQTKVPGKQGNRPAFIPGRPQGEPIVERIFTSDGSGGLKVSEQQYRVREGEYASTPKTLTQDEIAELQSAGLEGPETIDTRHKAHETLLEMLKRPRAEVREAVKDAEPAEEEAESEEGMLAEIARLKEQYIQREQRNQAELEAVLRDLAALGIDTSKKPAEILEAINRMVAESKKEKEEAKENKEDKKKETKKEEPAAAKAAEKGGDHGHGHGEKWHVPRTMGELGWLALATAYGVGYTLRFFWQFVLHPVIHTAGYVLSGDPKHPWTSFWNGFTGDIKKAFGAGKAAHAAKHSGGGGHGH